ncbi:hypothetical protein MP228_009348 [Amoeboaphelidium protococcarum]|nr:hypothetical protein MP228_009348 [Amoeboaphelidium protococcarum]
MKLRVYLLYLWRNQQCVVLGRNQNPFIEARLDLMKTDDVPLIRRQSGGGTVYHDIGNACYTFMMPRQEFSLTKSLDIVVRSLNDRLDLPVYTTPRHDIWLNYSYRNFPQTNTYSYDKGDGILKSVIQKKVGGSAYRVIRDRAFHHGTLLIDSEPENVTKYLGLHNQSPASGNIQSKAIKSVTSQVGRIRDVCLTTGFEDYCDALTRGFQSSLQLTDQQCEYEDINPEYTLQDNGIQNEVNRLQSWDYKYGYTPDFQHTLQHQDGTDTVLHIHRCLIQKVESRVKHTDNPLLADTMRLLEGCKYRRGDILQRLQGESIHVHIIQEIVNQIPDYE